jgi:uncharacterized membrane protein YfcA
MFPLAILFGLVIGLALGLTGGGGAIFAVPLLVYGLSIDPHQAVGISLAAVGATAAVGAVERLLRREVEVRTGLLFAAAGIAGAPVGSWVNGLLPAAWLMVGFAGLMAIVAIRMWRQSTRQPPASVAPAADGSPAPRGPACRRTAGGELVMSGRCRLMLVGLGLFTGVLAGLFGVGGGFVIVPALVLFSGMDIRRAVATSLLVVALVSTSGVASYVLAGRSIDLTIGGAFVAGGVAGMFLGTAWGRRISGPVLQRGFAAAMVLVGVFVVSRSFLGS